MSDTDYPKFPHLENFTRAPHIIENPLITVTEKIDGFNARFGRTKDGEFWIGSRNIVNNDELQGFREWALMRQHLIPSGITIFGEWAGRGIQGRIDYGEKDFYLFDYLDSSEWGWAEHPEIIDIMADKLMANQPPLLYEGGPITVGYLMYLRDNLQKDFNLQPLARTLMEGVVIRAFPMAVDEYGHALIVKYKTPGFEEIKSAKSDKPKADMTGAEAFVEEYVTEERLIHVKQQVSENGTDAESPKAIGDIIRTMYNDIVREGADDFALLDEEQQKFVGKVNANATRKLLGY